jgi:hypothetical protein
MSRYVVTELEGFPIIDRNGNQTSRHKATTGPGLSCQVIDTTEARRLVATFPSEAYYGARRSQETQREMARAAAEDLCGRLNSRIAV